MQRRIIELVLLVNLVTLISAGPMQSWTVDILEVNTYSSDPNIIDLGGEVVRIRRGVFGFSGFWDLKVDLYDDALFSATAERSKDRAGPFSKMPMGVDNETLSNVMNKFYKEHAQSIAQKCSVNAPVIEDIFTPPLTVRKIEAHNCEIETDNLPNIMMEGYYRLRISVTTPNYNSYAEGLYLIENKKY